jgi:hypothetical protein
MVLRGSPNQRRGMAVMFQRIPVRAADASAQVVDERQRWSASGGCGVLLLLGLRMGREIYEGALGGCPAEAERRKGRE